MNPCPRRSGFSLIEALVVLAVGGMALAIIFSIGVKAGDTGFALGRRAMSVADTDIAVGDLRATFRSFSLPPARFFDAALDTPIEGDAQRLTAPVVMERATQCAPQGWAGQMVLTLETVGNDAVVYCSIDGHKTSLLTIPNATARFSYSTDGLVWGPRYSSLPPASARLEEARAQRVFIRMQANRSDIIEQVTSGPPAVWMRPDDLT
ncbi:prepilin-type N-terminal cleavage/methylation domain-containing protein [Brevundimonas sp. TWP2-3-4b1]|uniref:prepilin-type N-terminal cleavage/methylation domain-containing protein n=1 Tax=Brevundimonas sp. TWP2-3-4b1 TaxID=2804580 RepID=UPI003CECBF53